MGKPWYVYITIVYCSSFAVPVYLVYIYLILFVNCNIPAELSFRINKRGKGDNCSILRCCDCKFTHNETIGWLVVLGLTAL